jgi:SAM-dependent methyltransferase
VPEFDYSKEFGAAYHRARQLPARSQELIAALRADKLRRWIAPEHRVLEYGVGFGWNLAALACREKVGFDVAELRAEVEAKGIRFESHEDSLPKNSFDVVLAHHVLEHVPGPVACLSRLRSLLRSAGRLLVFVPFEREPKYRQFRRLDRAHHLYSWTPRSLEHLLVAGGWVVEELDLLRFRFDRAAALATARLHGGLRLFRFIRALGVNLFPEYEICIAARRKG